MSDNHSANVKIDFKGFRHHNWFKKIYNSIDVSLSKLDVDDVYRTTSGEAELKARFGHYNCSPNACYIMHNEVSYTFTCSVSKDTQDGAPVDLFNIAFLKFCILTILCCDFKLKSFIYNIY